MTEPSSLEPSIALAAYAEPLASNRRVLVFGNALASLSLQLLERGARSVHVCDPDAVRAAEANARNRSTQISFSSLAESDLSLRDASFELALVDNLGAFDAPELLRTVKRTLGSRGVAVVACPNPEAAFPLLRANTPGTSTLDYYALYDAVAAEFEHVRMLGQTPFVGYAIADFSAAGEPEPALDTSFVPGGAEEPDAFIALASMHEVRLDEFSVIQLPTRRMLSSIGVKGSTPVVAPAPPASPAKDAELARLNQWLKELESRASTADERADHVETELEELRPQLEAERQAHASLKVQHDKEVSALRAELSALRTQATNLRAESSGHVGELTRLKAALVERDQQLAQRDQQLAQRDQQVAQHSQQLAQRDQQEAQHVQQLAQHVQQLAQRDQQVAQRDQQLAQHAQQVAQHVQQLAQRDQQVAQRDQQLAQRDQQLAEHAAKGDQSVELAEFEGQLVERGGEVRRLEQELRTAERTGRELVRELGRRNGEQAALGSAELERALAEREADLQAAAWTIESLSLRLELAGKPTGLAGSSSESSAPNEEAR